MNHSSQKNPPRLMQHLPPSDRCEKQDTSESQIHTETKNTKTESLQRINTPLHHQRDQKPSV